VALVVLFFGFTGRAVVSAGLSPGFIGREEVRKQIGPVTPALLVNYCFLAVSALSTVRRIGALAL